MPISERVSRLGSGVFANNDLRKQRYSERASQVASGLAPLLDLSLGSTDLQPPPVVIDAISSALRHRESASYCLHAATLPFREAVAAWAQRRFDIEIDPEREALLLVGSQEGTAHLPLAVLNPGDHALLLDPYYPSHMGGLRLASADPILLPLHPAQNWKPPFHRLSFEQWQKIRLMVLGFPHNPTATTGQQSWLDQAVSLALDHDIVLAHDNPYLDLALDGEAPALLRHPAWRQCGIEFFSFSKSWCLGGYRLAFAIGAPWLIKALKQLKNVVDFNQSLALQAGAVAALQQAPDWPQRLRTVYRERRDRLTLALEKGGWPVRPATMALYLWLELPPQARLLGMGSEDFCAALLENTGICLTPGNGFGPSGEGWLRLALVRHVEELENGAARIASWLRQFQ